MAKQLEFSEKQMLEQNKLVEKLTAPKEPSVTVKLPTIELRSFNGDKLKWSEFWDSFQCAVHQNKKLSDVEKFNYLQTKLIGEAKSAISGLSLCNENYNTAVSLLQERFGRKQDIVDVHYQRLMNIASPSNKTESLRCFLDTCEKHLRSLEVLGEDINQNMFVSMIKSKLPQDVLLQLEIQKGASKEWSVRGLREGLQSYSIAREHAEQNRNNKQSNENDKENGNGKNSFRRNISSNYNWNDTRQTSAETLISTESQNNSFSNKCRYCAHPHWSDECTNYRTIAERKRVLKGACFKCLKVGHSSVECRQNRLCVHCGEIDSHHRSLCPKRFATNKPFRQESVNVSEEVQDEMEDKNAIQENVLISSGESVLMQTATTEAKGPSNLNKQRIRLLLDTGSQRTFVTERLTKTLGLLKEEQQEIRLATFGCNKPKVIKTPSTKLEIRLNNGEYMTINANIVPDITGTIERKAVHLPRSEGIQHILKSVDMADTIPSSNEYSTVDILIGNDYYLDIVLPQRIEIQPGLYLLSSKLGWLLTGRANQSEPPSSELDTNMLILTYGSSITESSSFTSIDSVVPRKPDLEDFWSLESTAKTDETNLSGTEPMCEITECSNNIQNDEQPVSNLTETPPFGIESESYSSASRLLRVTAFAHRFINKIRKKSTENETLTRDELDQAERLVIAYIQGKHYGDVIKAIKEGKQNNVQRQLGLYLDNSGILRCGGRLDNAELSEAARHPILLPKQDRYTHLTIEKIHKEILHSGVSQTLSRIRYKYWIPSGRATVKRVLSQCLVCRRHEGGAYKMPTMAPLPKTRVSAAPPFSKVGLDYLGPLYVKGADETYKIWICLFTCLVTRAVHLELMHNLCTEEFLMGFRRFIATRGKPDEVISDKTKQFKLASQTLDIVWKRVLRCPDVQNYASESGINWTFIVELAPWMGGFYERLVGLVKRSLRKAIGRKLLSEVQMQTIVKEVESVVNARPIAYVGDDINSMITLSPAFFLSLDPKTGIPETDIDSDEDYIRGDNSGEKIFQIWKKGQKILNTFWKVWKDEYLLSLRERTQMRLKTGRIQSKYVPCVGDVVLIKDDVPRGCWKLGKITNLIVSRDGENRSAKVTTQSGRVIGRPLNLLYPIEVTGNIDQSPEKMPEHTTLVSRPKRAAAERASAKLKILIDENIN